MVCGCEEMDEKPKEVNGVAIALKGYEERRTTDSLYFLVLVATWVAMTILGAVAIKNGDIDRLIAPYNSDVRITLTLNSIYHSSPCVYFVVLSQSLTYSLFSTSLISCRANTVGKPLL